MLSLIDTGDAGLDSARRLLERRASESDLWSALNLIFGRRLPTLIYWRLCPSRDNCGMRWRSPCTSGRRRVARAP
jgi:hypothetical protein